MAMQNLYTSKTPEMYSSGDASVTMDSDVTYNSPAALHGLPTVANVAAGTQETTASIGPLARHVGGGARAAPELPARREAAPAANLEADGAHLIDVLLQTEHPKSSQQQLSTVRVPLRLAALAEFAQAIAAAAASGHSTDEEASGEICSERAESAGEAQRVEAADPRCGLCKQASGTTPGAAAVANGQARRSGELRLNSFEPRACHLVLSWIEREYDARQLRRRLQTLRDEIQAATIPLDTLGPTQLGRLFTYHSLQRNPNPALLTHKTCSRCKENIGEDGGGEAGAVATSSGSTAGLMASASSIDSNTSVVVRRRLPTGDWATVDGSILAADAIADTGPEGFDHEIFASLYVLYRPELHEHVCTWANHGVRLYELLSEEERASKQAEEAQMAAAADTAEAKSSSALDRATGVVAGTGDAASEAPPNREHPGFPHVKEGWEEGEEEPVGLRSLRIAHHLGISELVRAAACSIVNVLTVDSSPRVLMIANAIDCHLLRDHVSGWIVAHLAAVTASSLWGQLVPTREQTRILALAAATQANPFGLRNGEAATDAREMLAWSRETLVHMETCLQTAKEELAADIARAHSEGLEASAAPHAQRMIDDQEERLRVVRAFVAQQEADALADAAGLHGQRNG